MAQSMRVATIAAAVGLLFALVAPTMAQQQQQTEQPLKQEKNPPGDIPDNQVFITYASPRGFSFKVPEGWARKDLTDGAVFADKYGRITVAETTTPTAPDVVTAKQTLVPELEKTARAVAVKKIQAKKLPAGATVLISYDSNSDPSPVTNKAIRLENDRYYFWKDGRLVMLDFSAPAGADNADQWDMMAKSFHWR
jgi:hypothetical protein